MKEEEIMQGINRTIAFMKEELKAEHSCFTIQEMWAIQGLLDLYQKEKEKNKKLDKENQGLFELYNFNNSSLLAKVLKDYKKIIEKQQKEIEKEKEKNIYLTQELETRKWVKVKENGEVEPAFYISKDKIREKIEEINNENLNYSEDEYYLENEQKGYTIDKLKELLEESE